MLRVLKFEKKLIKTKKVILFLSDPENLNLNINMKLF